MCKCLEISRKTYYLYLQKDFKTEDPIESSVIDAFEESHGIYGTRRIKASLSRKGIITSRRRVRRIMIKYGLESVYTHKKYRNHKSKINEKENPNLVNREFNERK